MIHTPDNDFAPQLAVQLYKQLQQAIALPDLPPFPAIPEQPQLSKF